MGFTEELLEEHEVEVAKIKMYLQDNNEIFNKVSQRQEIWSRFMELERRAKDPSRLLNSRGTSLLMEEKERNKINKALPKVEKELEQLVANWETVHRTKFLLSGVCLKDFIDAQKENHLIQLEVEKLARERQKKKNIKQETRYGAKPVTPGKLKRHNSSKLTPKRQTPTPKRTPRIKSRLSCVMASMRSPRAGRVSRGTSPR